jgi:hypothetical protein
MRAASWILAVGVVGFLSCGPDEGAPEVSLDPAIQAQENHPDTAPEAPQDASADAGQIQPHIPIRPSVAPQADAGEVPAPIADAGLPPPSPDAGAQPEPQEPPPAPPTPEPDAGEPALKCQDSAYLLEREQLLCGPGMEGAEDYCHCVVTRVASLYTCDEMRSFNTTGYPPGVAEDNAEACGDLLPGPSGF